MEELLLQSEVKVGDIVTGEVIKATEKELVLDLKQFAEGVIYINEYDPKLDSFNGVVKVGDKVEAMVLKVAENDDHSVILLSRLPLIREQNNSKLESMCDNKDIISVKINKNVGRGLVSSYLGNEVFIPASQVDLKEVNLDDFVGQTLEVKLMEYNEKRRQFVATRRELLYQAQKAAKSNELASFKAGQVVKGIVSKVEDNLGAFVRFEHNQGLIHRTQLSHIPFKHVEDVLKVGQEVEVKVLKVEGNRIDLSLKALRETPYQIYAKEHSVGEVVTGKVIQKLPFGIILEVAPYVTGLLHANEISWNPNDNTMASIKIGQEVSPAIISIDAKKERIGFSLKSLIDNPWARVKAVKGDTVKATITEINPGRGLVVSCFGVDGFIDIKEVSMKEKSSKLEDYYTVGDEVDAVVTYVDTRAWRLELSIKRFVNRVEREQFEEYMKKEQEKETVITLGDLFKDVLKK